MHRLGDSTTIRTYDAYHEVYDAETTGFWENFPREIMDTFVNLVPGNEILDLGSGPGRDAIMLRERGMSVTCLDGSENMVTMTRKLGFRSVVEDMRNIQFPDGSFDGIWAYSSIMHVTLEEGRNVINGLHRILRKGGVLLLGLIEGGGSEMVPIGESSLFRFFEYYDDSKIGRLVSGTLFNPVGVFRFQPRRHVYINHIFRRIP